MNTEIFNDLNAFERYIDDNCPSTRIVYKGDNGYGACAIIQVKSFSDCHKLFHKRTNWCIADSENYWKKYAGEQTNSSQFFIINFVLDDTDIFKLIGFTVKSNIIFAAHAQNDANLLTQSSAVDYVLKGRYYVIRDSAKNGVNYFWQYANKFGLKKFIKYNILGEEKKDLKYFFKNLFS